MQCKDAYKFICDNLDQEVDSPECVEIRRHLAECPDCSSYLDSLKKTITLYRTEPRSSTIPPSVHRRLLKVVQLATDSPVAKRKARPAKSRR
jgi:predicted anti-sigma-YlaC factor YlaD